MNKRLLLNISFIGVLCFILFLSACNNNGPSVYTVTFNYLDNTKVTRQVEDGKDLSDIPELPAEKGYTYSWDLSDFNNVKSNLTVNAVKTANEYTVFLNADGGTVSSTQYKVYYNESYSLPQPNKDGHRFDKWILDDGSEFVNSEIYKIDNNVSVKAVYLKVHKVTFKQEGFEDIVIEVVHGEPIENAPMPIKTDKDWRWNMEDFSNIVSDITIQAVATNYHKVTFDIGSFTFNNDDVRIFDISSNDCLYFPKENDWVYSGLDLNLFTPKYYGYIFKHWAYNGEIFDGKDFNLDKDITITAVWKYDENSSRWDSMWV